MLAHLHHARRLAGTVAVAIVATALGLGFASAAPLSAPAASDRLIGLGTSEGSTVVDGQEADFGIRGAVRGLYPGKPKRLVLTVANHRSFDISVTSVTVAVRGASARCPASNLSVARFAGPLEVAARGTSTTTLAVSMAAGAPDACQAAVFQLTYSGTAIRSDHTGGPTAEAAAG
jgi:hypothetical protein